MKIDILTLFPNMFQGPFDESIIKRARDKNLVQINIHNLRNWAKDKHKTVDDRPYGGGTGMILMVEPIYSALQDLKSRNTKYEIFTHRSKSEGGRNTKIILLTPQGTPFIQKKARELAKLDHLILIAGHYEGYDERIRKFVDEEISIGDYILTGGELPTMVITDTVTRLLPNVLEKPTATSSESFEPLAIQVSTRTRASASESLINHKPYAMLEFPQYTHPENFKGYHVPRILLSGDHQKIAEWRKAQAMKKTKSRRPDLIQKN